MLRREGQVRFAGRVKEISRCSAEQRTKASTPGERSFWSHFFAHIGACNVRDTASPVATDPIFAFADYAVAFDWIDATVGTPLTLGDDESDLVDIGFDFDYFGTSHRLVYVASNGFLVFGTTVADRPFDCYPLDWAPQGMIGPLWTDLDPTLGGTVQHVDRWHRSDT